jgi:diadenosine tetraphosphate (Ap4A) HIT family hydrolase
LSAIACAADVPATEGRIVVVPKEHVPSIHALPIAAQKGVWALVSHVWGRLRTGLVPDCGFSIGFLDGLTSAKPVPHTVIHVVPRRAGDQVALPSAASGSAMTAQWRDTGHGANLSPEGGECAATVGCGLPAV